MLLNLIADVPRHFETAVWRLSSKGFRRHIKARSVSSKLVVKSAYNPLKTPRKSRVFQDNQEIYFNTVKHLDPFMQSMACRDYRAEQQEEGRREIKFYNKND